MVSCFKSTVMSVVEIGRECIQFAGQTSPGIYTVDLLAQKLALLLDLISMLCKINAHLPKLWEEYTSQNNSLPKGGF